MTSVCTRTLLAAIAWAWIDSIIHHSEMIFISSYSSTIPTRESEFNSLSRHLFFSHRVPLLKKPKMSKVLVKSMTKPLKSSGGKKLNLLVFSSSFNPPTVAHEWMVRSAYASRSSIDAIVLLITTNNPDKPIMTNASLEQRLDMMKLMANHLDVSHPVLVIETPSGKFFDQLHALEQHFALEGLVIEITFVVGLDTITRIFDRKYYPAAEFTSILDDLFASSKFICIDRPSSNGLTYDAFLEHEDVKPFKHKIQFVQVTELPISDVSSTRIRQAVVKDEANVWSQLVSPSIRDYILQQGIYRHWLLVHETRQDLVVFNSIERKQDEWMIKKDWKDWIRSTHAGWNIIHFIIADHTPSRSSWYPCPWWATHQVQRW